MPPVRVALPLLVTGSAGLALLGAGAGGLAGLDGQLRDASRTAAERRAATTRQADCPIRPDGRHADPDEV